MIDLGTIFLFLALLIPVVLYVARPLLERSSVSVSEEEQTLSALMAERDRLLDAIQELELDHTMGKIPTDVHDTQREDLLRRGVEVLRSIDNYQDKYQVVDADSQLEAAIAARRTGSDTAADMDPLPEPVLEPVMAGGAGSSDQAIEDLIAARRGAHAGKAAGFCHQCGQAIRKNDRFCANCGTTVDSLTS